MTYLVAHVPQGRSIEMATIAADSVWDAYVLFQRLHPHSIVRKIRREG